MLLKWLAAWAVVLVAVTAAPAPVIDDDAQALMKDMIAILYDKRTTQDDGYSFEVETADGQYRQEVSMTLNKGKKDETTVVMGQYSFRDAFGNRKHYIYMADKNGYKVRTAKKEDISKLKQSLLG